MPQLDEIDRPGSPGPVRSASAWRLASESAISPSAAASILPIKPPVPGSIMVHRRLVRRQYPRDAAPLGCAHADQFERREGDELLVDHHRALTRLRDGPAHQLPVSPRVPPCSDRHGVLPVNPAKRRPEVVSGVSGRVLVARDPDYTQLRLGTQGHKE